jgi:basic amino acid/polyamine antiporter, APA family
MANDGITARAGAASSGALASSSWRPATPASAQPTETLSLAAAIALIVGIVIGAGIFKAPALVASFSPSVGWMFAAWVLGGVISLIGALVYAELATTYPNAGGDYHFLQRAFGPRIAFLFAWARFAVIVTGSIALLAFVFGDYMTRLLPLGPMSEALYAAAAVAVLTWVNVRGIHSGAAAQTWLTVLEVLGLLIVVIAGLALATQGGALATPAPAADSAAGAPTLAAFGMAMVFVLLTFGGWNEAAYISAELKNERRNMVRALVGSIALITALYLLVTWAYWAGLGLQGMAQSQAVAADLMKAAFGDTGEAVIAVVVAVAALTSINATMIVGARSNYAVGRQWPLFRRLGKWDRERGTPVNALLVQGALALALVALGLYARGGFQTMVDYTAPVFWFFFLLCGAALMVLRRKDPQAERPFKAPLYPLLPLLFCAVCAYMLWSSLVYVKVGALAGVAVLATGALLLLFMSRAPAAARGAAVGKELSS